MLNGQDFIGLLFSFTAADCGILVDVGASVSLILLAMLLLVLEAGKCDCIDSDFIE
jgi:hypothetical protein